VSGSARVIERLKMLYEVNDGDVEFDDERDITDITGLLKLFLRELPDSIIPTDVAEQFLQVQAGKSSFSVLTRWTEIYCNAFISLPCACFDTMIKQKPMIGVN